MCDYVLLKTPAVLGPSEEEAVLRNVHGVYIHINKQTSSLRHFCLIIVNATSQEDLEYKCYQIWHKCPL